MGKHKVAANKRPNGYSLRLVIAERRAFDVAAKLAGLELSQWMRERLRRVAIVELREHGRDVPFLK